MPMTCVAYGCYNRFVKGSGKQFFRFPMKDPERLSQWIAAIRSEKWKPSVTSRLCSDHFTEKDYMLRPGTLVPRLRLDAVPTAALCKIRKPLVRKKKGLKKRTEKIIKTEDVCDETEVLEKDQQAEQKEKSARCSLSEDNTQAPDSSFSLSISTSGEQKAGETQNVPEEKNEHDPEDESKKMACVANNCSNYFFDGCKKQFFRFPMEDPYLFSKWVLAIQRKYWKPTVSSVICSDHFADKDFNEDSESLVPQLRPYSVPCIFHVRKQVRRKKHLKRKMAKNDALQEGQTEYPCEDHTYSSTRKYTRKMIPKSKSTSIKLRKQIRTLQRQVQRQRHTIKSLAELITKLKQRNKVASHICLFPLEVV